MNYYRVEQTAPRQQTRNANQWYGVYEWGPWELTLPKVKSRTAPSETSRCFHWPNMNFSEDGDSTPGSVMLGDVFNDVDFVSKSRDVMKSKPRKPARRSRASEEDRKIPMRPLLHAIRPTNFLSFAAETKELALLPLNVLIGPNGSGKSNLLEAIAFIRSACTDFRTVLQKGGGAAQWIGKSAPDLPAEVEANVTFEDATLRLRHHVAFRLEAQSFHLERERLDDLSSTSKLKKPQLLYDLRERRPVIRRANGKELFPKADRFQFDRSVLAQRRDPENYPEISYLAEFYDSIRLYREWEFGRNSIFRQPQDAAQRRDRLEEDSSNLGMVLGRLSGRSKAKELVINRLRDLYEGIDDIQFSIEGGTVQLYLREGDRSIPAQRLSDGTLRYLCLLAVLCDPHPPPLIGIEEPELGLHPDLLPKVADMLVDASQRCQLIVTTHSDILIESLSEQPESVVVCEKHNGNTEMKRLVPKELAPWLKKYRLGQLWTRGQIGGTRW